MGIWDWDTIKYDIRDMTQRKALHQLSEEELVRSVTNFYQNIMPVELHLDDWRTFYTATLKASPGEGDPELGILIPDPSYLVIGPPLTVDGTKIQFVYDWDPMRNAFPETQEYDPAQPTMVLWYQGQLIFKPVPDADYEIKAPAIQAPTFNAGEGEVVGTPNRDNWADFIAVGTAIQILMKKGDRERAESLGPYYRKMRNLIMRPEILREGALKQTQRSG